MDSLLTALLPDPQNLPEALGDAERGPLIAALFIANAFSDHEYGDKIRATFKTLPDLTEPQTLWWIAAASQLQDPAVDEAIDSALADPKTAPLVLQGLLRGGTDWHHLRLTDYMKDDERAEETRFAAAWLLAIADPDEFHDALQELDDGEDVLILLRALTLAGDESDFADLLDWRQELADDLDPEDQSQLDAALATLSPAGYIRTLLQGESDREWLGDDRPVADFLTHHGVNDWAETLALFRMVHDREAFELAAAFATSASLTDSFDDLDDEDLDPGDAARWMHEDPTRVAYQLAIGEEEELAVLLIEATLHQSLLQRGIQPPPISGLPLSSGASSPEELTEIFDAFTDTDQIQIRVALIRTLTDLRRAIAAGELSRDDATPILDRLSNNKSDALRKYLDAFDQPQSLGHHLDWGCRGLHHINRQLRRPPEESIPALATGLFFGPQQRAPLYRAALHAVLASETGTTEDQS